MEKRKGILALNYFNALSWKFAHGGNPQDRNFRNAQCPMPNSPIFNGDDDDEQLLVKD